MLARVLDCKLDQLINKNKIPILYHVASHGLTSLRYCIGPPIMRPSSVFTRVETAKVTSTNLITAPKKIYTNNQNNAPGPPTIIASDGPTILPIPMVVAIAVNSA